MEDRSICTCVSRPSTVILNWQDDERGTPVSSKKTWAAVVTTSSASVSWPAPCALPHWMRPEAT